jgi:hypothetical protein
MAEFAQFTAGPAGAAKAPRRGEGNSPRHDGAAGQAFTTAGGSQDPSMIDGLFSSGQ